MEVDKEVSPSDSSSEGRLTASKVIFTVLALVAILQGMVLCVPC